MLNEPERCCSFQEGVSPEHARSRRRVHGLQLPLHPLQVKQLQRQTAALFHPRLSGAGLDAAGLRRGGRLLGTDPGNPPAVATVPRGDRCRPAPSAPSGAPDSVAPRPGRSRPPRVRSPAGGRPRVRPAKTRPCHRSGPLPPLQHRHIRSKDEALLRLQQVRPPLRPPLQVAQPLHRGEELRAVHHVRHDGRRHRRRGRRRRHS